ncbi:MAG TPA: hypothetical protein VG940_01940 [Gemmatimonadales bacterium]|nr:hypothetical protein [Gemmatimonadales bacterium]
MRKLLFILSGSFLVAGCTTGRGTAHWTGPGVDERVSGTAMAGWCPASGTVLLEVSEEDRIAGLSWRGSPLVADSAPLNLPNDADTAGTRASAAARYVYLDEVRGYRSVTGMARVTSADTLAFSATVEGRLQRVGEQDTVHFIATFDRVPLTRDQTLCRE